MNWITGRLVVVPIDMSDFSLKALQAASEMVGESSQLRVLHVLPPLEPAEPGIVWNGIDEHERTEYAKIALGNYLEEHGFKDLDLAVRVGDPGSQIAFYADDLAAGLIVIPSHGRGMLTRMLLGSTTDRVMHLAHCPVLVLKEQRGQKTV